MIHVVYTDNAGKKGSKELDKIISEEKTMVIRSATGRKIPHSRVFNGETLYFMEKGSLTISAKAIVKEVFNYVKLSEEQINKVFEDNMDSLLLSDKQRERWHKKCICLISFGDVEVLNPKLNFEKQNNMDDWLIIEKIEDVLVGSSIPYNYEKSKFI